MVSGPFAGMKGKQNQKEYLDTRWTGSGRKLLAVDFAPLQ
jgi:hypothetical protein